MKRSRSGTRPAGGAKTLAKHHTRFNYELCVFSADGSLTAPSEEEMAIFRQRHPDMAAKIDEAAQNGGLAAGSWQEKCFNILDSLVKQKRSVWFRAAVDPVKEHLPDYFTVIKQPMDLGARAHAPGRAAVGPRHGWAGAAAPPHSIRTPTCFFSARACVYVQGRSRRGCWGITTPRRLASPRMCGRHFATRCSTISRRPWCDPRTRCAAAPARAPRAVYSPLQRTRVPCVPPSGAHCASLACMRLPAPRRLAAARGRVEAPLAIRSQVCRRL